MILKNCGRCGWSNYFIMIDWKMSLISTQIVKSDTKYNIQCLKFTMASRTKRMDACTDSIANAAEFTESELESDAGSDIQLESDVANEVFI